MIHALFCALKNMEREIGVWNLEIGIWRLEIGIVNSDYIILLPHYPITLLSYYPITLFSYYLRSHEKPTYILTIHSTISN
jgi:hypothetical protein